MPKYLVIRFSSIGDIVLTTPLLRCLKKQKPDCEIHYITKASFKTILENNPNVAKIYTIEKDVNEVIQALKKEDYDFVIDLHHNLRSSILKRKLKKPAASFPKLNVKKFLLTQFKIDRLPDLHVVARYFEAVKPLGVYPDFLVGDFVIPPRDEVNLIEYNIPNNFYAFAIGAQLNTKKLPLHKIIELVQKINKPIVLLGGENDVQVGKEVANQCANSINLCGKLNLNQSASVVKQALKLITHDTGMMHIGSCFRKQTISIWGNTVPAFGMYPYMPMNPNNYSIHQVENLKCRPCSKIGYSECPKKHFNCMNNQNIDAIVKDVLS